MFKSRYYLTTDAIESAKTQYADIKLFKYDNDFEVFDDAIILPLQKYPETRLQGELINAGGVCDKDFNFLAGYDKGDPLLDYTTAYNPREITNSYETVIFCGDLNNHFGHFIQDSMTRLWYVVKHREQNYKLALLLNPTWRNWNFNTDDDSYQLRLLKLLNIEKERILIVEKPTQFKKVIVPKQSVYWGEGYCSDLFGIVYDEARKSITPKKEKKIYLSRSKAELKDIYNETYFEGFFKKQGFKILNPEHLPLEEQIAYVSGAEEIACTYGTLSHWSLFAKDNTKLINLLRYPYAINNRQLFIDHLRNLDSVYIDTNLNILPSKHAGSPYLIGPTVYWQDFLKQELSIDVNADIFEYLNSTDIEFGDYIKSYLQRLSMSPTSFAMIYGYNFDYSSYLKSLYNSFIPSDYGKLRMVMIKSDNPLFKEKVFALKKGNVQKSKTIMLLAHGQVYTLDDSDIEEKYWSYLNGNLFLMDKNYKPTVKFTVPVYGKGQHKPKEYKGAQLNDISVYCSLTYIKPGHGLRNYILRHCIIKPLVDKKLYKKLKKSPERFFGDSKNAFMRFIGKHYVRRYNTIVFDYRKVFKEYFDAKNVYSMVYALKQGMDEISCEYIDHFINLSKYWYRTDYAGSMWTDHDHLKRREYLDFEGGFEQPFPKILFVDPYVFLHNYSLNELPNNVLGRIDGRTIIDGGGYNGDTALAFHSNFPNSEIHVFEPLKFYTSTIESFLEMDSCNNKITIINKGLGESEATAWISFEVAEQKAKITTIDEHYASYNGRIGLIKLDTTGSELNIIKGASSTIRKHRPVIAAAMYYSPEAFFGLKDSISELIPDYRFMIRRSCLRRPQTGIMLIAY